MQISERWKLLLQDATLAHGEKMESLNMTEDASSDFWALEPKYLVNPHNVLTMDDEKRNFGMLNGNLTQCVDSNTKLLNPASKLVPGFAIRDLSAQVNYCGQETQLDPAENISCLIKSEAPSQSVTASPESVSDLESFQDLTYWCRVAPKKPSMSWPTGNDELNTPTIELGEFLFPNSTTHDNINEDCYELLAATSSDMPDLYSCVASTGIDTRFDNSNVCPQTGNNHTTFVDNNEMYQYVNFPTEKIVGDGKYDVQQFDNNSTNNFTMDKYVLDNFDCKLTVDNSTSGTVTLCHQDDAITILNATEANINLDVLSDHIQDTYIPSVVSEHSMAQQSQKPSLKLDFTNIKFTTKPAALDTPEIIKTALAMETDFKNFSRVQSNQIDDVEQSSTTTYNPDETSQAGSVFLSESSSEDCSRDDDDEDYIPPGKRPKMGKAMKNSKTQKVARKQEHLVKVKRDPEAIVRRGRPPKRLSVSSESTADCELSKYRELRDKNNEASRRSRLNRKLKEQQYEEEAKELAIRNNKLTVEVQHLEKLVNTLRNALMHILLKK